MIENLLNPPADAPTPTPPKKREKRQEDVLWFKILDRFGLPTLFALIILIYLMRIGEQQLQQISKEREANREVLAAIVQSLNANTEVMHHLSDDIDHQRADIRDIKNKLRIP